MCGGSSLVEDNAVETRVGNQYNYADEIRVGETVRFFYSGGSEDGERTVFVAKVDSNGLEGPTKERGGDYRRYNDGGIVGQIEVISEAKEENAPAGDTLRVPFSEAGEKLLASLTGEQLAELYSKYVAVEGDGAEFDANSGEVVVLMPPKVNKIVEVSANAAYLENKRGESFGLYLHKSGNRIGISYKDIDDTNVSLETLRDKLTEFLS